MRLFDLLKKNKSYICAQCKKKIADNETYWIDDYRFFEKCANPSKTKTTAQTIVGVYYNEKVYISGDKIYCGDKQITVEEARKKESDFWKYQAYMDYAKGSYTPEEAYTNRGFVKNAEGKWAFNKYTIDKYLHLIQSVEVNEENNRTEFIKRELIFKMQTPKGGLRNFTYSGHTRYSPNRSSRCGYGSDDWIYLCKENEKDFLLMFTDNASCGTGWMCTSLLHGDKEKLIVEDVLFWGEIAYSKEREKMYALHLLDIDSVRHLLPTSSRCCSKLTDKHYYG